MMEIHQNVLIIPLNVTETLLFVHENFVFRLDDFKPASVVKSEQAELTVGSIQDVTITLPNIEVSSKGCHR
jgi:hypothetical protein